MRDYIKKVVNMEQEKQLFRIWRSAPGSSKKTPTTYVGEKTEINKIFKSLSKARYSCWHIVPECMRDEVGTNGEVL